MISLKAENLVKAMGRTNLTEAKNLSQKLRNTIKKLKVSPKDMIKATRLYLAMKKLFSKHDLSAITIKCFDLLKYSYTACLGMSLCNNQGLVSGCEADLQATFTMMAVSFLTNQPCWMANPSRINKDENLLTLAHCTIATNMITNISKATLLLHMESGKGVALRGPLKDSQVTLVRLGGNLDQMLIATGRIVKSDMKEPNLCTTQVKVKLKGKIEDWLTVNNYRIFCNRLHPNFSDLILDLKFF